MFVSNISGLSKALYTSISGQWYFLQRVEERRRPYSPEVISAQDVVQECICHAAGDNFDLRLYPFPLFHHIYLLVIS